MADHGAEKTKANEPTIEVQMVNLSPAEEEAVAAGDELKGLTSAQHAELLAKWGPNEIPEDVEPCWLSFAKRFWGPMPGMIWVAILVEGINQEWIDFVVLFLLQLLNGLVGFIEERNAGNAIAALKNTLRPQCRVRRDGEWKIQDARELVPGDLISVKLGDVVPADARVVETDSIDVDQSALTGESLPVTVFNEGKIVMGSSLKRGMALAVVHATGANTFFGKAAALMGGSAPTSRFQQVLYNTTLFMMVLSVVACSIIFIDLLVEDNASNVLHALAVVVIILVASIPIATQVVATSTMAVGARLMAKKKAIVARLGAIEELAGMTVLCSDKTGTLTKNILSLREPVLVSDHTDEKDMVLKSSFACHWEEGTQDAIDICILQGAKQFDLLDTINTYKQVKLIPFNPTDKRAVALMEDPTGKRFKVMKGAPQIVLRMSFNAPQIADQVAFAIQSLADRGFRALGVAVSYTDKIDPNPAIVEDPTDSWEMLGLLAMFDPPRDDTKHTIATAISMGVEVKMVTGDQLAIAKETCRELGMGANILSVELLEHPTSNLDELILNAHGFAEVMPEHKYQIVQSIQKEGRVCGMTGDGVNDAPALKRANIGIAVQGATDAAKAAADIVLIEPGLSVVIDAIVVSRKIFQRMRNYCIYRIAATIQLLFFFFFCILFINPRKLAPAYDENFTLPVISLVLITVLNDVTMIAIAYDKVIAGKHPQEWNLTELYASSAVLGFVPCFSSLLLVIFALLCHESVAKTTWYTVALGSRINEAGDYYLSTGEIQTVMYLKIAVADFLTLFCARTNWFIWERAVGRALSVSFLVATASSTALALAWPFPQSEVSMMESINIKTCAVVWAYNLIWMVLQDLCKVATYDLLFRLRERKNDKKQKDKAIADKAGNMISEEEKADRIKGHHGRSQSNLNMHLSVMPKAANMQDVAHQLSTLDTTMLGLQKELAAVQQAMAELKAFSASGGGTGDAPLNASTSEFKLE